MAPTALGVLGLASALDRLYTVLSSVLCVYGSTVLRSTV
jgi:hypothetical protein